MSLHSDNNQLPLYAGATLGVLGGGQLGRMFAIAGLRMGYKIWVFDPDPGSPAGQIATRHFQTDYHDEEALKEFGHGCDAVTIEFENIPSDSVRVLSGLTRVTPSVRCIDIAQDRRLEKQFAQQQGLMTAPFAIIEAADQIAAAVKTVGFPCILKTARMGYDGKGQVSCHTPADIEAGFESVQHVPCVLEKRIDLLCELSVVLARSDCGRISAFPVAENTHTNGILDTSVVPASVSPQLQQTAVRAASTIASALEYVGVLAVEFFVDQQQQLLVNEMAPRPHNSGHYTLDATVTCQFEQQVRMLCGLSAGCTDLLRPSVMLNLLGDSWQPDPPDWAAVHSEPGSLLHMYGKAEPRPGRKMGHINILADSSAQALATAEKIKQSI